MELVPINVYMALLIYVLCQPAVQSLSHPYISYGYIHVDSYMTLFFSQNVPF